MEEQILRVSRYVAGDLSRSERAEFEAWLVASPELAAEVEMERRLRRGMHSAARRGWIHRAATSPRLPHDNRWQMAAAASVVGAVFVAGLVMLTPSGDSGAPVIGHSDATPRALGLARTVRLGSMRGLGTSPDVSISRADTPSELTIEPDVVVLTCEDGAIDFECAGGTAPRTPQYAEYEMELVSRRDASVAWRSSRQLASADRMLSFRVSSPEQLASGDYDLLVRGHSPDHEEVVARFWMRVTQQ